MHIKSEEKTTVTLVLDAHEAGRIAADILANPKAAGTVAVALATRLKDQGFFREPPVLRRTEWAGPDNEIRPDRRAPGRLTPPTDGADDGTGQGANQETGHHVIE